MAEHDPGGARTSAARFDETFGVGRQESWTNPADPQRRVAEALRRLVHRSVAYDGRPADWAAWATTLEGLLEGPEPSAGATRYDPAEMHGVDQGRARPNSRGTHPLMGVANPAAPPLIVGHDDDGVFADLTYDARFEGLSGFVQGGFIAAGFDLLLAQAVSFSGSGGVTASLTVNYRKLTPIGVPLRYEGRCIRIEGRKLYPEGRLCRADDGTVMAEAEGLFIKPRLPIYDGAPNE